MFHTRNSVQDTFHLTSVRMSAGLLCSWFQEHNARGLQSRDSCAQGRECPDDSGTPASALLPPHALGSHCHCPGAPAAAPPEVGG